MKSDKRGVGFPLLEIIIISYRFYTGYLALVERLNFYEL